MVATRERFDRTVFVRVLPARRATAFGAPAGVEPPGEVIAGVSLPGPGVVFGPRVQRRYQVMVIHRGRFTLERDGFITTVREGEVLVLTPGHVELFRFATDRVTHHYWIGAETPPLPAALLAELETFPPVLPTCASMARILEAAEALPDTLEDAFEPLASLAAAALLLFRAVAITRGSRARGPGVHPAVDAARALVLSQLHAPPTLRDLAAAGYVSPLHLIRLFRRTMGTTPMGYVWAERLRLGLHLLEHTGLPITTIAANAGFRSYRHFGEIVRRATGRTPRDVRRHDWKEGLAGTAAPGDKAN